MSYILDALRRADAERQRGQMPALQQVAQLAPLVQARAAPLRRIAPWFGLAVLMLAGATGWWLFGRPAAQAPPAMVVAPAPSPPMAQAMPPPLPAHLPPVAPAMQPRVLAPAATPAATRPAVTPRPAPATTRSPTASPLASAPARAITASALPEPQRSAVTRLQFGGAAHSQDRAQSFVLLAGQIVREGEPLAPGITLERIAPRSLLLRVGEQLVELPL